MTPRLSGHFFFIFGLVLKSLLGIARQWSREKFAILTPKPRSHVRILIHRTWAIGKLASYNLGQNKWKTRPPLPPKSRMGKWRVFGLRAVSSLIWGGWGFAVPFYFVQDCNLGQSSFWPSRGFILDLGGSGVYCSILFCPRL